MPVSVSALGSQAAVLKHGKMLPSSVYSQLIFFSAVSAMPMTHCL